MPQTAQLEQRVACLSTNKVVDFRIGESKVRKCALLFLALLFLALLLQSLFRQLISKISKILIYTSQNSVSKNELTLKTV